MTINEILQYYEPNFITYDIKEICYKRIWCREMNDQVNVVSAISSNFIRMDDNSSFNFPSTFTTSPRRLTIK